MPTLKKKQKKFTSEEFESLMADIPQSEYDEQTTLILQQAIEDAKEGKIVRMSAEELASLEE